MIEGVSDMKKYPLLIFLIVSLMSCGCSVRKVVSLKRWQTLQTLKAGDGRAKILRVLGTPEQELWDGDARRDLYTVNRGRLIPAYGRAGIYGLLDVGTLGLFELVANPLEDFIQTPVSVLIEYDAQNEVRKIQWD